MNVVVAPSGVWVIDAKNYRGLVERRDHGTWRKVNDRLFIAGRDRTSLVNSMGWQVDVVGQMLRDIDQGHVPVHVALCFTDSGWSLLARPFKIDGVWIIWAKRLVKEIRRDGSIDAGAIRTIAQHLSAQMPRA